MRTTNKWITALGGTALLVAAVQLQPREVTAADHIDAPLTLATPALDIADFYAWHTERGTIVAVLTFAALQAPGDELGFADDTLYTIHIDNTASIVENDDVLDNDNDNESDIQINVRFGQNSMGEWGVQFNDVPGADEATFFGPVQETLSSGSVTATAGVFDDPFFFDFDGFTTTLTNLVDDRDAQDLAFAGLDGRPVDFFAGLNTHAIVVEFPADDAAGGNPDNFLQVWATTGVL